MTERVKLTGPQERFLRALSQGRADGAAEGYQPRVKLIALGLIAPSVNSRYRDPTRPLNTYLLHVTQAGFEWLEAAK